MRSLFLIFLVSFFVCNYSHSQYIDIHLVERGSLDPIANAKVFFELKKKDSAIFIDKSDFNGHVVSKDLPVRKKIFLMVKHPMFKEYYKPFVFYGKTDTTLIDIVLSPVDYRALNVVNLKASSKVDTVYGSTDKSVLDFEVIGVDSILLLSYNKTKSKATEITLKTGNNKLYNLQLPEAAHKLIKDYRGNVHAISNSRCFCFGIKTDSILCSEISKDYYLKYLAPIIDTTTTKSILSNYSEVYPAFEYYVMDKNDSTYRKITNIKDDWMLELYRSEYKWVDVRTKLWARRKEQESGIDKEIWIGANYFTQSIYWKEVYAPMFQKNDNIYVFNYPKDLLEVFDKNGDSINSIPIFHHYQHRKSGFKRNLIQDGKTGVVYATYQKEGFCYIAPIDLFTGKVGEMYKLSYRYVDKIRVFNNKVFYIYRPFESIQKRFIYSEKLPYKYRSAKVNSNYLISTKTGK